MKRLLFSIAIIFIVINNFSSCIKDKAIVLTVDCDTTYYAREIRPIIQTKCAVKGCHVSGGIGNGDFTKFSEIKDRVAFIKQRINLPVSDPSHMPNGDTFSENRIAILSNWIDQGAKGCD